MTSRHYVAASLRDDALRALQGYSAELKQELNANMSEIVLAGIAALREHDNPAHFIKEVRKVESTER